MFQSLSQTEAVCAHSLSAAFAPLRVAHGRPALKAEPLARGAEAEVVEFLSERLTHAVNLLGLVADNGLVSPHNRGTFYACRDEAGRLEGVALIGHATLFEARTPRALRAFARAAQARPNLHWCWASRGRSRSSGATTARRASRCGSPAASCCSVWTAARALL